MGCGVWESKDYEVYASTLCRSVDTTGRLDISDKDVSQIYVKRGLSKDLNPYQIIRECCDNEEHPNTLPVIIGIDVTGSMGSTAMEVAAALNNILTELYEKIKDVEFAIMGIGDSYYDNSPCQMSQFESDVRIAQWLDEIYFEGGGGPNNFESYTYAWYMGAYHTKLDCWKRGKKGIIITIGDEICNPYIEGSSISNDIGDDCQKKLVSTKDVYDAVKDKYNLYHIHIEHGVASTHRSNEVINSFGEYIGTQNVFVTKINGLAEKIVNIIEAANTTIEKDNENWQNENGEITW